MSGTSWSIAVEGTPEEIQRQVHEHEARYWHAMPLPERLLAHHVCGHAVEHAREHGPSDRWVLQGGGSEDSTSMVAHVQVHKVAAP
jgi:hypothetical protein